MTLSASLFGHDVMPDGRRPPRERPAGVRVVRRPPAGTDGTRR